MPRLYILFRRQYFLEYRPIFYREIKTEGNQRKDKISVVKRKYVASENKSFEILEVKNSSSTIKRFNYENKQMFGNILSAVKKSYSAVARTKLFSRISRKSAEILNSHNTIPIKDTDSLQAGKSETLTSGVSKTKEPSFSNAIMSTVLSFPLSNVMNVCDTENDSVIKLNILREKINSLSESSGYPSITSILEKTMPPDRVQILERWKRNQIQKMGEEKFKVYQQALFSNGSSLHNSLYSYLSGTPAEQVVIQTNNAGHWKSLQNLLLHVKEVRLLEEYVNHPFLGYRGIVDCFAYFKDNLVIIDWKTSEKFKPTLNSTFDAPLQIAAYAGALNFDPKFNYKANKGLIAVAYNNGSPATVHYMNETVVNNYWQEWLKRLKSYWENIESYNNNNKL